MAILPCLVLAVTACDDIWRHHTGGVSGQGFKVGNEVGILHNGYHRGDVTWVVVRSWPSDSTPAQRLADPRFALGSDGEYRVRRPDGQLGAPEPHLAYVFYGDRLTVFPIRMREDDFIGFRSNRLAAYADVEAFLRRFEPAVVPWKPAGISSPQFESHAAFDPRTGDLYFVRSSPSFEGWRILVSHCTAKGWSAPEAPAFAGDGFEADPWFTPDGKSLYFISSRTANGVKRQDLDIWRVDRGPGGVWGVPTRLPEPVNSDGPEWFPRAGPDGWLYFGSNRPGGLGGNDIWRAHRDGSGPWAVENLGPAINTAGDEYEPLLSADGARMIVMADGGLYESRRTETGWSARVKLGPDVNVNGSEIGAVFSPNERSLLFSRDTKGPDSGEFFVWHEQGHEAWPPSCPPETSR